MWGNSPPFYMYPPPTGGSGNPLEDIERNIAALERIKKVLKEEDKSKDKDKKSGTDYKSLAQFMFWMSPFTGAAMLYIYFSMARGLMETWQSFIK